LLANAHRKQAISNKSFGFDNAYTRPLLSSASMSHVSPAFAPVFGNCIKLLRKVLYTESGQPFLVAGSGTLGWDAVAANLIEKDEKAVSRNSCSFGLDLADCQARLWL
jgi:aspartate aminotransferase-like enzyme